MATVTVNFFTDFYNQLGLKLHNLSTDSLSFALTNTAPTAGNSVLTDITQIAAGGGYTTGGLALSAQTWSGGKLTIPDYTLTATGAVAAFRYAVIFNNTATNKNLMFWFDYGSAISLTTGDPLILNFDGTNGVFTIP